MSVAGLTELDYAVRYGTLLKVSEELEKFFREILKKVDFSGVNIETKSSEVKTAIHYAAR